MKARIAGTVYEVEVVPYFPEGMFAGFTDISGSLQPGMVVYKPGDLEFLETPPKLKPETDWEAFRREAAKDILCAVLAGGIATGGIANWANGFDAQKEELVNASIGVSDELIKQLKEYE